MQSAGDARLVAADVLAQDRAANPRRWHVNCCSKLFAEKNAKLFGVYEVQYRGSRFCEVLTGPCGPHETRARLVACTTRSPMLQVDGFCHLTRKQVAIKDDADPNNRQCDVHRLVASEIVVTNRADVDVSDA
jgi:hypothetical protein